jgi:predicted O-methyltransferase YrrM
LDIIHAQIEQFAEQGTSASDALLQELLAFTNANHPEAHMVSGHLQGKFLEFFSSLMQPSQILEVGTFTGYSALCLAKGLKPDGELHTIELRENDAQTAKDFFIRSAHANQIHLHVGDAKAIIPTLDKNWDLVFLDADKTAYVEYFNMIFPRLRKGGFILADNVFFHGQVLQEKPKGKSAKGIVDFVNHIKERTDVEKLMLTLRDGLYLIKKL